ncbi:MAG: DUF4258 domain-containing protein [Steroidobacteraceae bacterium]
MSATLKRIRALVAAGKVLISNHGYDELAADDIFVADVLAGLAAAQVVEDYPDATRGPSVLVLESDAVGDLFHAVWGIPQGKSEPAVLVTAYRPDPQLWVEGFLARRK